MKAISTAALAVLVAFTAFSGYVYPGERVKLDSRFDIDEVSWIRTEGTSSIGGKAFLRLANGDLKGCAGFNVELLPAAEYANERILKTYGNNDAGQILMKDNPPKFTPDAKEYHDMVIKGKCEDDNSYLFENLNTGEYYVIAFIIWDKVSSDGASGKDGGGVMKRVSVSTGEHKTVLLKN